MQQTCFSVGEGDGVEDEDGNYRMDMREMELRMEMKEMGIRYDGYEGDWDGCE